MQWLETIVVVSHVIVAVGLVIIILMQQGKGAGMGAALGGGGGASQTVFGSQGSGNFLTKMTTVLGILFFVTSFTLAFYAKQRAEIADIQGIPQVEQRDSASQPQPAGNAQGTQNDQTRSEGTSSDAATDNADQDGADSDALPELQ